ncbi:hypothetical protein [Pedobacter mucosus]|uniref:hypothetical protein n=1 Tax=Pedobacter mucosus TaxID=2895286 RepID=UPI001EE49759|nr:hypothetical protein [Pedobacter mucosus]UKT63033.1 hypothetical protein LOK61_14800 [Pedobacter mucosus]
MITETLQSDVVAVLKKELDYPCSIWYSVGQVILEISNDNFEKHMGCIVQQIQHIIDRNFPERDGNLSIIIRNTDKRIENAIKIWKPV